MDQFSKKLAQLKDDLITQGDRVVDLTMRAVECFFENDPARAKIIIDEDGVIDRVDVEIERACIPLLRMGETKEHSIRSVLTVVKVNNELERIADCAVEIAEQIVDNAEVPDSIPRTFLVMANSILGILRDANRALAQEDSQLAQTVLSYDDTVEQFKKSITLDAQERVAKGQFSPMFAFKLLRVTKALERIADHCTNVCEQVIYLESGLIVRHLPEGWSQPSSPDT
ncbi:MAG: phosphate signaling complex PhoU family protein [Planctomycetota bacterium]|jgi:phosphate transport system protein